MRKRKKARKKRKKARKKGKETKIYRERVRKKEMEKERQKEKDNLPVPVIEGITRGQISAASLCMSSLSLTDHARF